jgi:hypothetical protein
VLSKLQVMSVAILIVWSWHPPAVAISQPTASLWYRGRPAGVPRADDLADIRAAGFTAVTWPESSAAGIPALRMMAEKAGLEVFLRGTATPLTVELALRPAEFVDLRVARMPPALIAPLAWRAIAHGARVISFDAGAVAGTGVLGPNGAPVPWVTGASAVLRQLQANGELFGQTRPGPPIMVDSPVPHGFDVTLLEARKSWVLVATQTSTIRARATVHLPAGIPYALWLNLFDGSTMAMLEQTCGPKWVVDMPPLTARMYVIDKTLR